MPAISCHACGTPNPLAEPIPRDAECASCGADLRCCRNCRHYDPAFNNHCRETEADPVEDKARRNFCEFFVVRAAAAAAAPSTSSSREAAAREGLDRLFGGTRGPAPGPPASPPSGPPVTDRAAEARKALDRLFGGRPGATPDPEDERDA